MTAQRDTQRREYMTDLLGELMWHGTIQQLRAVGARLRWQEQKLRPDELVMVAWRPFDLPEGYVQLWFASGFTCGISPEGEVSS
jgi:hypothetical protein